MNNNFRDLFDVPDDVVYLNCAGNSPQLKTSTDALITGAKEKEQPWKRKPENFFDLAEEIRSLAAATFGGNSNGYAVVPAASYGISTAARIIETGIKPDQNIVLMEEEFPSNVLPWKRVSKETNANIITVNRPEDNCWTEAILNKIDQNTKVVAVSACHWTDGTIVDLSEIKDKCRRYGSTLVVDATQMLGANPIDIEKIDPDFLVASGYKWLLSPYGFSLMYVSENFWDNRPLEETWLGRQNAEDFAGLVRYNDNYLPGARRFDVGEKNSATILPGAIKAVTQIKEWGVANISDQTRLINNRIIEKLREFDFIIPEEEHRSPHMFGALTTDKHHSDIVTRLAEENIFISQRGKSLRFSPHLNINEQDMDKLLFNLAKLVK